jgi:hypothetical protein
MKENKIYFEKGSTHLYNDLAQSFENLIANLYKK